MYLCRARAKLFWYYNILFRIGTLGTVSVSNLLPFNERRKNKKNKTKYYYINIIIVDVLFFSSWSYKWDKRQGLKYLSTERRTHALRTRSLAPRYSLVRACMVGM